MKVLLRRNVSNLGKIGEVVDVKPGFARNYLLTQRLAVQPTAANLKAVEAEKQHYLEELAKERAQLAAKAELLQGKEITITARANEEGILYGSIGPAQIVAALAATGIFLEPKDIILDSAIRQLDKYDVLVRFAEEISATIHVWVVQFREEGEGTEGSAAGEAQAAPAEQPQTPPADAAAE